MLISCLGAQAQSQPRCVQSLHAGKDRRRPCFSNAIPVLGFWQGKATQNPSGLFGKASRYLHEVLFKTPEDVKEGSGHCSPHCRCQPALLLVPRAELLSYPLSHRGGRGLCYGHGVRLVGRTVPPAPGRQRKPQGPRAVLVHRLDSRVSGWPCRMFSRCSTSSRRPGRPPKPPPCRPGKRHPPLLMLKGSSFSSRTWGSCPPPQPHTDTAGPLRLCLSAPGAEALLARSGRARVEP